MSVSALWPDLLRLLPPPESPAPPFGDWDRVEQGLGTPLPADYRRWVATYGSGVIDRFLLIVNPFDLEPGVTFPEHVGMMLWGINRQRQLFGVRYPVAFFPEPGGFLPCGATENGSLLGWRTVGRPDDWPMMVTDDHYQTFRDLGASSLPDVVIDLLTLRSPAFEDCLPKRPFEGPPGFGPCTW